MRALLAALLTAAATPAFAQQGGNPAPAPAAPAATCTPEHAALGHCALPAAQPAPAQPKAQPACTPEHAAMGHCTLPAPAARPAPEPPKPQPACTPEHAAMGHCTLPGSGGAGAGAADPHAAHSASAAAPPVTPPPAAALSGPEHAADAVYGAAQMGPAREGMRREHGDLPASRVFFDRIETRVRDGSDGYLVEGQAWYGGDIDKLWIKTELEGDWRRGFEEAEIQGLWSRAIDPWFDVQAGLRYDPRSGPDRTHLVLGVQGLAPYWWEVEGAVFLSNKGEVTARAEAEYDLRITQQLILQPRGEVDLSLQDIRELGIGSGLTSASVGARLRYQLSPLVAPYIGVEFERAFGDTRRFRRDEGDEAGGLNLVAGLRLWF